MGVFSDAEPEPGRKAHAQPESAFHHLGRLGTLELLKQAPMTIGAKYEDGAFKPLENVKLTEGTRVEVHVLAEAAPKRPRSVRDWPIFGMWAGRDDIPDGVTYEDRIRQPRY